MRVREVIALKEVGVDLEEGRLFYDRREQGVGDYFFDSLISDDKILFDNHSPKGHHFHINDEEFQYKFTNEDDLIKDFEKLIFEHYGVKL